MHQETLHCKPTAVLEKCISLPHMHTNMLSSTIKKYVYAIFAWVLSLESVNNTLVSPVKDKCMVTDQHTVSDS